MRSTILPGGFEELLFGGPDRPDALRNALEERIEAVPAGGEIDWATYYFRDVALAEALVRASDRGVSVRLAVEGTPRQRRANAEVLERLGAHGLGGGLGVHRASGPIHPHLHVKIYAFSHPRPVVFVGSFNPSGRKPETDLPLIREIGDQDRGHNLLVGLGEPFYRTLADHAARLAERGASSLDRFRPGQNRTIEAGGTSLFFYPRLAPGIAEADLKSAGSVTSIRGAISHLKQGPFMSEMMAAAARGARVRLLVHDTERRVPSAAVRRLADSGIEIERYIHPDGLPLHAKFVLIEQAGRTISLFGSFNFNPRSRYLNHELLVRSEDRALFDALGDRFEAIASERG